MSVSGSVQAALHQMVPLTKSLGIEVDNADPGRAVVRMPKSEIVLNHLGMFHAAALYALAESAAATLFAASFDLSAVDMITRGGVIEYRRVVSDMAVGRASIDEAGLARVRAALESDGRVDYEQPVRIVGPDEETACEATFSIRLRLNVKK